jgi:hypothetical protein
MLKHQGYLLQAPYLFKEYRYFFLIGGYGSGKSAGLSTILLIQIKLLQGKTDTEGHGPRILVGGISLAHLIKTTIGNLKEELENSRSDYQWDSKNNRLVVGNVTVILTALSEPGKITGYDTCCSYMDECVARNTRVLAMRNGRPKEIPIQKLKVLDCVYTRNGWRHVTAVVNKGRQKTVLKAGVECTADHKFYVEGTLKDWFPAEDVHDSDTVLCANESIVKHQSSPVPVRAGRVDFGRHKVLRNIRRKLFGTRRQVWDISVDGEHEFFANGVLVHNCDDLGSSNAIELGVASFKAVTERTRQRIRGWRKPFIASATSSQGQGAIYQIYQQFKKSGTGFVLIRAFTRDNFYLDPEYVEALYKVYSREEARVFLEGEFLALSVGKILGDFDWARNYVNVDLKVGPTETIYWAQDFNEQMHRGLVGVVRGTVAYIVQDFEFVDIREAPKVIRRLFPTNKIIWLPDNSAKEQIQHFTAELHKYGIYWIIRSKNPSVEDTAFAANKMFYTKRLVICKMAKTTADDCTKGMRDKNGLIPKGSGPLSPIHRIDGVRYFCYFILSTVPALRDLRRVTIWRHMSRAYDEEVLVEDMGEGFQKVSPNAFAPTAKKSPFKHLGVKPEKDAKPRGRPPKIHKVDA